jgi:hypothetical protein
MLVGIEEEDTENKCSPDMGFDEGIMFVNADVNQTHVL